MAENQHSSYYEHGNPPLARFEVGAKVWISDEKYIQLEPATYIITHRKREGLTWKYSLSKDGSPEGEVADREVKEEELESAKEDDTV